MIEPLLETVSRIIRTGQNSNSYKFALLRALAHIASRETSNPKTISRDRLAECFVAFYWDLTLKYHVRQGTNPDKDPRVMRLIRNLRLRRPGLWEGLGPQLQTDIISK